MRTFDEFRAALQLESSNRELRRTPAQLGIALFDSIHQVDPIAWEAVTGDRQLSLRPGYLAALEAADPPEMRFRYIMLFDGSRPVAVATVQMIELTGEAVGRRSTGTKPARRKAGEGKRAAAKEAVGSVVRGVGRAARQAALKAGDGLGIQLQLCGNSFLSGEHGLAYVADVDPAAVFHGLADALYRIRRADKLHGQVDAVLVKDFLGDHAAPLPSDELVRFDYRRFEVDPTMVVPIDPAWTSMNDYMGAMTSKYRARVRSARKKGKQLRREALSLAAIEDHADRLHELVEAVAAKASFRVSSHPPSYFVELKRALGDDFELLAYWLDDCLVGFTTTLAFGDQLEGHYLGLDYEHNLRHAVYQNILYDDVQAGIERRAKNVWLGRTALEIKSGIGAVARPTRCYIRHRGPLRNRVLRPIFKLLKPTRWTPRNPFPEAAPDDGSQRDG